MQLRTSLSNAAITVFGNSFLNQFGRKMPGIGTTSVVGSDTLACLVSGRCDVFKTEEPIPMTYLSEDPTYLAGGCYS